jgi:hypothetical protein
MGFNRYTRHTFYFTYELERGEETLEVEVGYGFEDGDVGLESVLYNGQELETTEAEDMELHCCAVERANDDVMDAEADYGDYLRDMRRDMED